jgi:hypothetical protein
MLDVHIDDFFRDVAVTLLTGLQQFPAPRTLFVEDICGPDEMDEFGLHSPRHLAALGAIQWLRDEEYVRFGIVDRQESVDDFVLSSKAFTRLLRQPDESEEPLFRRLHAAVQESDSELIRRLLREEFLEA